MPLKWQQDGWDHKGQCEGHILALQSMATKLNYSDYILTCSFVVKWSVQLSCQLLKEYPSSHIHTFV